MAARTSTFRLWVPRWRAAQAIQARSSASAAYGLGIYLTMSIALTVAAITLQNTLRFVQSNAVLSTRQPLFLPMAFMVAIVSLYLGLSAALAVARERDRGTLQVLLFGPVDESSFLLGYFIALLKVYGGVVLIAIVWVNLVTWLLHLAFSVQVLILLVTSLATVAAVIAFGLLVAVWGGRTRAALVYFILVALLLIGLQLGREFVNGLVLTTSPTQNDPILLIRSALVTINLVVEWISPYSQLSRIMDDLLNENAAGYVLHLAVTLAQALALLTASILILKRKGARS